MADPFAWPFPRLPITLDVFAARVAVALVLALVSWRLATAARHWFDRMSARSRADVNLRVLLSRFFYLALLTYGLFWALEVLGVSPAAIVTSLGVLGLAVGLAIQDILKNFFAGVYLLFERPFRIGDEISLRDHRGHVVDVGMRITTLRTEENVQVLIPNAIVLAEIVINRSTYQAPTPESPTLPSPEA